jgi:hypothetical protein
MRGHMTQDNQSLGRSGWVSALAGVALLLTAASAVLADDGHDRDRRVFPPQSHPYGESYAEWAARYWQWSMSFPANADPGNDTAPVSSDQSGKVWFLPGVRGGATVTRQITVPHGKALFFPALSVFYNNADCPVNTTFTEEELLAQANGAWDFAAKLTECSIDGVPVKGLENPQTSAYRLQTGGFDVTVADHDNLLANVYGVPCFPDGGTIDQVAVGAFLMIKPLPPGRHTIQIVGAAGPPSPPDAFFFVKDITYEITVVRGHDHEPCDDDSRGE